VIRAFLFWELLPFLTRNPLSLLYGLKSEKKKYLYQNHNVDHVAQKKDFHFRSTLFGLIFVLFLFNFYQDKRTVFMNSYWSTMTGLELYCKSVIVKGLNFEPRFHNEKNFRKHKNKLILNAIIRIWKENVNLAI
jgi:hypothetical protein